MDSPWGWLGACYYLNSHLSDEVPKHICNIEGTKRATHCHHGGSLSHPSLALLWNKGGILGIRSIKLCNGGSS